MREGLFVIVDNAPLTDAVYEMRLSGDTSGIRSGQFVNVSVPGFFLRRPISVCEAADGALTLVYKVVGGGTDAMSRLRPGESLDLLTGLGSGYDLDAAGEAPLLLGGGVGVPPLYRLARELREAGKRVTVILGFNTAGEVFYESEFRALGCEVTVTTVDGSCGVKGFVTDAMPASYSYFYTCGPMPMLRAVYRAAKTDGEFSLEERMGCGFGACMGCSIETNSGYKRVCKDGPVFKKEELKWES